MASSTTPQNSTMMLLSDREAFAVTRRRLRISQTTAAEGAGIPQSHLSKWENGILTLSGEKVTTLWHVLGAAQTVAEGLNKDPEAAAATEAAVAAAAEAEDADES